MLIATQITEVEPSQSRSLSQISDYSEYEIGQAVG